MSRLKSILMLSIMLSSGCGTLYTCKEKANHKCIDDYARGRIPAGIYVVRLKNDPTKTAHAVNWYTYKGEELLWDESFQKRRHLSDFSLIIHKCTGPLLGWPQSILPTEEDMKKWTVKR